MGERNDGAGASELWSLTETGLGFSGFRFCHGEKSKVKEDDRYENQTEKGRNGKRLKKGRFPKGKGTVQDQSEKRVREHP